MSTSGMHRRPFEGRHLVFTLRTSVTALVEQIEKAVLLILRESLLAQTHLSIFTNSLLVRSIRLSKLLPLLNKVVSSA